MGNTFIHSFIHSFIFPFILLQVTLRRVLEQEKDFERENRPKCQKKKIIVPGKYSITDPDSIVAVEQLVFLSKR